MDVFIVRFDFEGIRRPLLLDLGHALLDGSELVGGEDAIVLVGASECDGTSDIFSVEETVVGEGRIVLLHDWVEALCNAS